MVEQDEELLESYLDGALDVDEARTLRERLAVEPALAGMLEDLRQQRAFRLQCFESCCGTEADGELVSRRLQVAIWHSARRRGANRMMRIGGMVAACVAGGFMFGWLGRAVTSGNLPGDNRQIAIVEPVKKAVPTSFVASDPSWPPFQTHSRIDPRPATDIMVMDPDGKVIAVQKFTSKEQADIFTQSLRRFERFGLNVGPMREEDDAVVSKLKSEGFNSALRVKGVRAGSPAAEAGLRADDLIVEVGNKSVPDVVAFAASVGRAQGPIVFTIQRGDNRVAIQALFE